MRATESFKRTSLRLDDVRRAVDAAAARGFTVLSFTGGEPLLLVDDLVSLIGYAAAAGMQYIRTGTNGFLFARPAGADFEDRVARFADALAGVPLRNFWISIDSADPSVHEEMRGFPGVIEGIRRALPLFHERGLYPTANLGINRNMGGRRSPALEGGEGGEDPAASRRFYDHYRNAFRRYFDFVIDLGFTLVSACYPMSMADPGKEEVLGAVYGAQSADFVVRYSSRERALLFQALFDTIPEYRSRVRVFSPRSSLFALAQAYRDGRTVAYPCRGGVDFFFMDAGGADVYPCGYRGRENLGKFWRMNGADGLRSAGSDCTLCDWECFRDPSFLLGPFLAAATNPLKFAKSLRLHPAFHRLWLEDLRYYRSCDFFDGRKAPDPTRLGSFAAVAPPP